MTRKEQAELNTLTYRYIHGRMGPKDMDRYRKLLQKRDQDAVAKLQKQREAKGRGKA